MIYIFSRVIIGAALRPARIKGKLKCAFIPVDRVNEPNQVDRGRLADFDRIPDILESIMTSPANRKIYTNGSGGSTTRKRSFCHGSEDAHS